jgi:integration host factor subunit alpha
MTALTKAKMAECLAQKIGFNKTEAKQFVDTFFEKLIETISSGHSVKLSGFGRFDLRDKSKRPGRNPKTGEPAEITARRVVVFHAGQKLKDAIDSTKN